MTPATVRANGDVLVVGSLNADLIVRTQRFPRGGETVHGEDLTVQPGGKSANQAVAAARLGAQAVMIGAVGDDANADLLVTSLADASVDVSRVTRTADVATGTAIITVDAAGENTIIVSPGANGLLSPAAISAHEDAFAIASLVCLCLEIPTNTVVAAAALAHRHGASVMLNLSPFADVGSELLAAADVLLVNEHELAQLVSAADTAPADWSAVLDRLMNLGIGCTVVTRGADDAVILDRDAVEPIVFVPAPSVDAVDTTGAGDAFTGALAASLAAGDSLAAAAHLAVRVGAYATQAVGAQSSYPTLADLEGWDGRVG